MVSSGVAMNCAALITMRVGSTLFAHAEIVLLIPVDEPPLTGRNERHYSAGAGCVHPFPILSPARPALGLELAVTIASPPWATLTCWSWTMTCCCPRVCRAKDGGGYVPQGPPSGIEPSPQSFDSCGPATVAIFVESAPIRLIHTLPM
jgi:hypothetical protein